MADDPPESPPPASPSWRTISLADLASPSFPPETVPDDEALAFTAGALFALGSMVGIGQGAQRMSEWLLELRARKLPAGWLPAGAPTRREVEACAQLLSNFWAANDAQAALLAPVSAFLRALAARTRG